MTEPRTVLELEELNERLETSIETLRDRADTSRERLLQLGASLREHLRRHERLLAALPIKQREGSALAGYVERSQRMSRHVRRVLRDIEGESRATIAARLRELQWYAVQFLREAESELYPYLVE